MARRGLVRRQSLVQRMRVQLRKDFNIQKHRGGYISNNWLRKSPWRRQFNFNPRKFEPSKHKRMLLGLIFIALTIGLIGWAQQPDNGVFHSIVANPNFRDPNTVLWESKTTSEWNQKQAQFGTCTTGRDCWKLIPSATTTAVALTNTTIGDLSQASGKQLLIDMDTIIGNVADANQFDSWGFYLTTNRTLPTQTGYDPMKDPSVGLLVKVICNSSGCGPVSHPNFNDLVEVFMLKTLGQRDTIASEFPDGHCPGFLSGGVAFSNSCFLSTGQSVGISLNCPSDPACHGIITDLSLNFTGSTTPTLNNCGTVTFLAGNGCSSITGQTSQSFPWPCNCGNTIPTYPWFNLNTQQYYFGIYALFNDCSGSGNCSFYWTFAVDANLLTGTDGQMFVTIQTPNPSTQQIQPQIDTGGFFGPIIKALINIGIFIFNAILGFIAFIVPALEAAFNFLESIIKIVLNGVGVAFGFPGSPGLGDDLFNFINSVITLFSVQVPNAFGQITNIFNGWINLLTTVFTTGIIGQIFTFLSDVLTFSVNLGAFAWTVFNLAALTYAIGTPWWLFFFAIAFNCDDGVEGWIKTWEFAKWLAFDIGVKTVTWLLNWTIDVLTAAIGFIPKPVIQMASAKFPRIPVIDIHGSFSIPRFDGSALKEGNLFAIFGFPSIVAGLIWYELTQTTIPGTLANLYSTQPWVNTATVAITFYKLFLPIFGLTIFLLIIPTLFRSIFGIRVEGGMPVTLGSRPRGGIVLRGGSSGTPLIRKSQKHLQGRLLAKISAREKIEKRVKTAVEKEKERLGEKATEAKAQAELAKKELARKPSGRDIKGPRLGPLDQE